MGRSFFIGTDPRLYAGSNIFAAQIQASPLSFGLSMAQAADYGVLNSIWRSAYEASAIPQVRTRATVTAKNDARAAVKKMASDLAKIINGTATVTDEQKISLGLSVRARPTPMPPPGKPDRLKVSLSAIGALELSWKCPNPNGSSGTIYHIWRRVGGEGELTFLGTSGRKRFVDDTIPAGSATVMYQIQGVRSTVKGPMAQFNVNFGVRRKRIETATERPAALKAA